jgi:hypothetical protein
VNEEFMLHMGLAVGAGIDTNVFFAPSGSEKSAAVTHIMPQLDMTNAGRGVTPNVAYTLIANMDYRQYYNDDSFVKDQASAVGAGVTGIVTIGTRMPWSVDIYNNFLRDVQPSYVPGTVTFDRDIEQAGARLRWRPNGGRLEEQLGYTFIYDHFENGTLHLADSIGNTIDFRSSFKFLPKTAIFVDVNQTFYHYLNDSAVTGKFDSKPLHVLAGLSGLVTPKMTALLQAGYGNAFYDTGPSASGAVVAAELGWILGPFSRGRVGYEHDFTNSIYGNYYDLDAAYAGWSQQVGSSFTANLGARLEHRDYHCATAQQATVIACYDPATAGERKDNWLGLGVDAHYFPRPWFSAGASYQLLTNISDFRIPSGTSLPGLEVSFVKHQVLGMISATF